MSELTKRHVTKIYPVGIMASGTDVSVAFPIAGMNNFSISVISTATVTLAYTVYTAPINNSVYYTQITATNVVAVVAGATTISTFDGNNNAYCKLTITGTTKTGGYSAGFASVILSYNER